MKMLRRKLLRLPTRAIALAISACLVAGTGAARADCASGAAAADGPTGVMFLMAIDLETVVADELAGQFVLLERRLGAAGVAYKEMATTENEISIMLADPTDAGIAQELVADLGAGLSAQLVRNRVILTMGRDARDSRSEAILAQSVEIIARRIEELGIDRAVVRSEGSDRIHVQLFGVDNDMRAASILGSWGRITFHLIDDTAPVVDVRPERLPAAQMVLESMESDAFDAPWFYIVDRQAMLTGDMIEDAEAAFEPYGPVVSFRLSDAGARLFGELTRDNVGRQMAIVLDGKMISAPVIREPILGGSGLISGNFTAEEAADLALLLRAGALPAPMSILEQRRIVAVPRNGAFRNPAVLLDVDFRPRTDAGTVCARLEGLGLGDISLQQVGGDDGSEFLIWIERQEPLSHEDTLAAVSAALDGLVEVRRTEFAGADGMRGGLDWPD